MILLGVGEPKYS